MIDVCQRQYGAQNDIDFLPMMIYSLPTPFYVDRPFDRAAMQTAICNGLQHLATTGVSFIPMPCNTAHIYYKQVVACTDIALLNMIDIALDRIPPDVESARIMATGPTIEADLYLSPLKSRGIKVVHGDEWQADVMRLIEAHKQADVDAACKPVQMALTDVDAAVIACTDIKANRLPVTVLDAGQLLAEATVKMWLSLK